MEQLQLEVESLVYKQEQERLETVIEDLGITDDLTGKSCQSTIDKKLEGESDPKQKIPTVPLVQWLQASSGNL